jgi:DNA-binding SARP family transcriptional activator
MLMTPGLALRLFGTPSMEFDGRAWPLRGPQRLYTIAALIALQRGEAAGREALAAAVWPDLPDVQARGNLRRHLHLIEHHFPKAAQPWLIRHRSGVAWNAHAPLWIDVDAFQTWVGDPKRRAEAIALYRGPLLEDAPEEALAEYRQRLQAACVEACREEALAARHRLDFATAIKYAERILELDEWREDALRLAMSLRYESGDRTSALALYDRFAQRLGAEMGIDPMPETQALRDAVLMNTAAPALGLPAAVREAAARETPRTVFVGRTAEMQTLQDAWRDTARGRGTTLFVSGGAGIGKSRLAGEFASWVRLQGGRVLAGQTSDPERYPYEPFIDALRGALPMILESPPPQPWLSIVAELLPELRAALPDLPAAEPLEPAPARARLFEAIARTIEHLARVRPLLLVLEDVQWSHAATLDVVELIARRIGGVAGLIVATYRSGEGAPELLARRRALQNERRASALELQPLGADDVGELVRATAGDRPGLAEAVYEASEGNPLFAAQLLRGLTETGELPDLATASTTVSQAIRARVATLDARSATLADVASAMGGSFTVDVLAGVLGWSEGAVLDALGPLLDRVLVRSAGGSAFSYTFAHALIAAAVYDAVAEKERALLHHRIAAVLSSLAGSEPTALASIARHWELGGEPARAGAAYADAAKAAFAAYAPDEGIALARSALALLSGARERYDAHLAIANAERRTGDHERWRADLEALSAAAASLGAPERFAALQEWAIYHGHRGDRAAEGEVIGRMLELAPQLSPTERCAAHAASGVFQDHLGHSDEAFRELQESLAVAVASDDARAEAYARRLLMPLAFDLGRPQDAFDCLEGLRRLVDGDASPWLQSVYLQARSHAAIDSQDAETALEAGRAMVQLGARTGDRLLTVNAENTLLYASQWLSSAGETRRAYDAMLETCDQFGYKRGLAILHGNRAYYEFELGCAETALAIVERHLDETQRIGDRSIISNYHKLRAASLAALGDVPAALAAARLAADLAISRKHRFETQVTVAEIVFAAGDRPEALRLAAEAVDFMRNHRVAAFTVEMLSRYLLLLLEGGDAAAVSAAARDLRASSEGPGAPRWIWHPSRVAYGLGRAAEMAGDAAQAARDFARGRAALERDVARLGEDARAALESRPFNRALLARRV